MKGLVLAGACIIFFVVLCAAALRANRSDKEYRVFLVALACTLILYALLYKVFPSDLGFLPRTALEPSGVVDFWNGVLVLLMIFHGMWTFAYVVTGPTVCLLTELEVKRHQGITLREASLQFQGEDLDNTFLRRRLPKLVNGGFIAAQDGAYVLRPRGLVAGELLLRVKRTIGDIEE